MNPVRTLRHKLGKVWRSFQAREQLIAAVSSALPKAVCVDVGASYFPHGAWEVLLRSPQTLWCAVEPNKQNLHYLQTWSYAAKPTPFTVGLLS